ncbi:TetR/AcrR family transcriptional regulator [Marinibactrum halimedae]|uniref:TetR family transcriptional regulator n=1 Tax=Marinibactrum halimedae TaxID=1444977 RepID=A0AA37T6X3_9GAMM|nr:TetR/AcrR family transcriptional regulator [Marinibactrum halimedae]MCD9459471.1 TetR/AcrR family transcriptional regulator [Marinibactrum halimedae]GLS28125.1 TetR family transcriptional regulator [Marinibactrum halimedae]
MDKTRLKVLKFREREQAILDTALDLLIKHGEDVVTVEQIANVVDIGKGTIYKHFSSKTEIYFRLLFDYERSISDNLTQSLEAAKNGDYRAPARAYFESRMADPVKDRLFQRLEEKLIKSRQSPESLAELHALRNASKEALNNVFSARIEQGVLKPVPPYFYYCAYWALTQGAVELFHSQSFSEVIEDMDGLMKFIKEVGIHMGNEMTQYEPKEQEDGTGQANATEYTHKEDEAGEW